MRKLEEFYKIKAESDEPQQYTKIAAKTVGLQEEYIVWVLNSKVHMNQEGDLIPLQDSPYVWLAEYCSLDCQLGGSYPGNRNASTVNARPFSLKGSYIYQNSYFNYWHTFCGMWFWFTGVLSNQLVAGAVPGVKL